MAWTRVRRYYLGYSMSRKQFLFWYELEGDPNTYQIFPTPEEFLGLADMFRNEGPIEHNSAGDYFATAAERVGEAE